MKQLIIQDAQTDDRIEELARRLDQITKELRDLCLVQNQPPRIPRSQSLAERIRQDLVDRNNELLEEFEDQTFRQEVLRHWFKKTTLIPLNDREITKGNYKPTWHNALSSAIEDDRCPVIKKVGWDRYVVVAVNK
jgi:hypothetical protein